MRGRGKRRIPEFRGAPTRTGRVIFGVVGGFWILLACLGIAVSLTAEKGVDLIAPLYGCTIFLGVGIAFLMPAFPHLVNRALRAENRLLLALWPYRGSLMAGGLFASMGLFPVLVSLHVVPMANADSLAPRWVGGIAGGMFFLVGVYILSAPWLAKLKRETRRRLLGLFPLLLFTGFAAIADWIAFGAGERGFGVSAGNWIASIAAGGDEMAGRIVFGLSGIFLTVVSLIGWWRYLRGRW